MADNPIRLLVEALERIAADDDDPHARSCCCDVTSCIAARALEAWKKSPSSLPVELTEADVVALLGLTPGTRVSVSLPAGSGWEDTVAIVRTRE